MKRKDKSISDNFYFMFHEFRQYRKRSMLLPLVGSILQIVFSLLSIAFPKMILDLIVSGMDYGMMLRRTIVGGSALILVSVLNSTVRNEIENCSRGCLYLRFVRKWEEKMMELDYERFSSQECKIQAEKARDAVSSPNWGIVEYVARIQELMENAGGLFAYSAIICTLHPLVLLVLLGLFAVEMWYGAVVLRRRQQVKEEIAQADRRLHYMAYGLRGMEEGKDIRMYAMAPWLRGIARKAIKGRDEIEQRVSGWERRKGMLRAATAFLRNGFAYIYLLHRYFQGGVSIGDFTLYFAAITGLGGWLERLGEAIRKFAAADQYVTDFRMFMLIKECDQKKKYSIGQLDQPVSFTLEKVSFSYENPVLREIDLEIRPGEKLAVVGVNGAGKTTLVKLLCGLLRPESGRILVNGLDIREFARQDYCGLFSAVFQNSGILPVSIRDNIALNVREEVDEEAIWRCVRLAGLERKILSLPEGLDTNLVKQISEHGTSVSGGELQKLLLARALYKDAPVLLLDEPTAALDPVAESRIYQNYNQMAEGKTAIFISHRLASTRFCDRIIVMEEGRIVETGTHGELLELGGRYAEMYQVQSQYYKDSLEV